MFEEEPQLRKLVDQIVDNMIAANIAEKIFLSDERVGKQYWNLATPDAFSKKLIVVTVLGYPEQVGVWSYTLLRESRIDESSMEPYFREFAEHDFGLVAINPNFFKPDIEGDSFHYQLEQVMALIPVERKTGFIGFSMGGKILVEFLEQHPELLNQVAGMVLIDPTLPNRLQIHNIRNLLDSDTLLVASEGEVNSPGMIASALLGIPRISFPGIHGEMPNKALTKITGFYRQQVTRNT